MSGTKTVRVGSGFALLVFLSSAAASHASTACNILLTNDDGIDAPGIHAAYRELSKLCRIVVSAPAKDQSGASHAILNTTQGARVSKVPFEGEVSGYRVEGSPAEAVAIAIKGIPLGVRFDLVISGINPGENTGIANLYSGTVNAAMEAVVDGVPSIAISQARAYGADYSYSAQYAVRLAKLALARKLPPQIILNVNIPATPIKGVKVIRSRGRSVALDGFDAKPLDATTTVFRPRLTQVAQGQGEGDVTAYLAGYITVAPLQLDRTGYSALGAVNNWGLVP
ncbi:MAG: 5'/3'-nucleotidase SurE [Proteobacteria bacterium]|nr:5'/3'-nucleotidase SurE [Pseudomonadota bacterium]